MSYEDMKLVRLRVRYVKDGRLAFLGHLEVMNTIMRSVRRSGVPFSVGNGFARRMRIQFSQALPVGASSRAEYYDLMLTEELAEDELLSLLKRATPSHLAPNAARIMPRKVPALEAWAQRARWSCDLMGQGLEREAFLASLAALQDAGEIQYMRGEKPKRIDLNQTLVGYQVSEGEGGLHVDLDTNSTNEGSLRPQVLFNAAMETPTLAGADLAYVKVQRIGLWHEENGRLVEPLEFGADTSFASYSLSVHSE